MARSTTKHACDASEEEEGRSGARVFTWVKGTTMGGWLGWGCRWVEVAWISVELKFGRPVVREVVLIEPNLHRIIQIF